MSAINADFPSGGVQTLKHLEIARQLKLLKMFTNIALIITGAFELLMLFLGTFIYSKIDNEVFTISSIAFLAALGSWWLARKSNYTVASWLLVLVFTVPVLGLNWIYGVSMPTDMTLLLPIAIAVTLLDLRSVFIITIAIVLYLVTLHLSVTIFEIYNPRRTADKYDALIGSMFNALIVLMALVAIFVAPNRARTRDLQQQNQKLSETLNMLEMRQKVLERTSAEVLEKSLTLKAAAQQQAAGSSEQVANVAQVNVAMSELSATATQISELARQIDASSDALTDRSSQIEDTSHLATEQSVLGLAAATQTLHISKEVTELYGRLQQGLLELKDKNSNSRQILDLLQSISRETHLLSLNASIEAAGAGQFGERFGVIAQEVKNLAERSNRSSAEVALQLKEAELSVNEAVEAVQSGFKKTLEMKEVAEQTGSVITRLQEIAGQAQEQAVEINNSLQEMREKSEVIRITTHQQRTSSEQVMESLHGLVAVAQQNSEGSQEVSHTAGELENVSRKLREVF